MTTPLTDPISPTYGALVKLPESDGDVRLVAYEVDASTPETVRLRRVGSSSVAPFFLDFTLVELTELVEDGLATYAERGDDYSPSFAPPGECAGCDRDREAESTFRPSHTASARCRSGHRDHCSCDTCF